MLGATLVAIMLGVGVALAARPDPARDGGSSMYDEARSVASFSFPSGDVRPTATDDRVRPAEPTSASSPRAAVRRFLAAEQVGDHAKSWSLLSDADRAVVGNARQWERSHAVRPQLLSFRVRRVMGPRVVVDANYLATLDETLGLVAPSATLTIETAAESGGYRVALASITMVPHSIDPAGVPAAASTWLDARRKCDAPTNEWSGGLIGDGAPDLVDGLCAGARPNLRGEPARLTDGFGIEPLVAAFGPAVSTWAYTVQLAGDGISVELVLAPVGERWLVIAAIPMSPARSG